MGKKELKKKTITKERLKDVLALRKSKEYDKIFETYGQTIFNMATPRKYKEAEAKEMFQEGRWEDIYRKYGKDMYDKYLYKMQQQEVYNETGSKPRSILNRIKNVFIHRVAPIALSAALLTPPVVGATMGKLIEDEKAKNTVTYAEELEKYNNKIETYAEKIRAMNLDDTQVFMKVMADMWNEIDGYKTATNEPMGLYRLSLDFDGVGVCRNFADDITAKLNEINPDYNARNIVVYMNDNEYNLANIKRTILESNETVAGENIQENEAENMTKIFGNHMVTAVDVPDKNITLILDPTNPGIGVFKDGKIHMFSTPDGKGIEAKKLGQFLQGYEGVLNLTLTEIKSFLPCEYSLEELDQMYGTEKQNEILAYLNTLDSKQKNNDDFIPKVEVDTRIAVEQTRNNITKTEKNIDLEK